MYRFNLAALCLSLAACVSEPVSHFDTRPSEQSASIVNGTREPQNTFLTPGQINAIGYLAGGAGNEFCSGTLISDRVVITAQHCTEGEDAFRIFFGLGVEPRDELALIPVAQIVEHPLVDFAVLILGLSALDFVPDVTPMAMNREDLTGWEGRWVDASGYGNTYSTDTGKFFASVQIKEFDSETVSVDGHGEQGICYGDSGGPILWQPSADVPPVIVGTEQWGDSTCVDVDHLTRVDLMADWVDEVLQPGLPPTFEKCMGEEEGERRCDEDILVQCIDDYRRIQDCTNLDRHCGWWGSNRGWACLPEECGEIDFFGACQGDLLLWCGRNGLREKNCADSGQECVFEGPTDGYDCADCVRCAGECTQIDSDLEHCGACDSPCAPAHGVGKCELGACELVSCQMGFFDADGDPSNGCEYDFLEEAKKNGYEAESGCTASGQPMLWLLAVLGIVRRRR